MDIFEFKNGTIIVLGKVGKIGPIYDTQSHNNRWAFVVYLDGGYTTVTYADDYDKAKQERDGLLGRIKSSVPSVITRGY